MDGGQRTDDGFGLSPDDSEKHAGRPLRPALALFPIPDGAELETKAHSEGLAGEHQPA
jgi:hypothetical protein